MAFEVMGAGVSIRVERQEDWPRKGVATESESRRILGTSVDVCTGVTTQRVMVKCLDSRASCVFDESYDRDGVLTGRTLVEVVADATDDATKPPESPGTITQHVVITGDAPSPPAQARIAYDDGVATDGGLYYAAGRKAELSPEVRKKLRDEWLMGARALEQEHKRLAMAPSRAVVPPPKDLAPQEQRRAFDRVAGLGRDGNRSGAATIGPDYVPPAVAARRAAQPSKRIIPTDLHIPGEWD